MRRVRGYFDQLDSSLEQIGFGRLRRTQCLLFEEKQPTDIATR